MNGLISGITEMIRLSQGTQSERGESQKVP